MSYKDYVCYIHTDSLMTKGFEWLRDNGVDEEKWEKLSLEQMLEYIKRIAKEVEKYVNERTFEETQKIHYNSQVFDFATTFEQEKIALSGLFKDKGRYATWTLTDEGKWKDEMSVTGLEIIRSDSPEVVKPLIKKVLEMLLKHYPDEEVKKYITQCKKELRQYSPEEIAENKGINKLEIYTNGSEYKKGTPHHIKGVANFKFLLNRFNLENEYDIPQNGNKAKVLYVQRNPFNIESLSVMNWPKEFDKFGIHVDYEKMIQNNFTKKVNNLLEVIGKEGLLNKNADITTLFK
mgnify:CR=1 FL=1